MRARDRVCDPATTAELEEVRHIHRERRPVVSAVAGLGGLMGAAAQQLYLFGNASVALLLVLVAAGLLAALRQRHANTRAGRAPVDRGVPGCAGGRLRVRPAADATVGNDPRAPSDAVGVRGTRSDTWMAPAGRKCSASECSAATGVHQVDRDRRAREIVIPTRAAAASVAATWVTPITGPGQQSSGVSTNERTSARIDF